MLAGDKEKLRIQTDAEFFGLYENYTARVTLPERRHLVQT